MAVGQYHDVIVCTAGAPAWTSNSKPVITDCPTGTQPQRISLYIPDETALETALYPITQPFDYAAASAIFVGFFASVILLWFIAHNAGLILKAIKTW